MEKRNVGGIYQSMSQWNQVMFVFLDQKNSQRRQGEGEKVSRLPEKLESEVKFNNEHSTAEEVEKDLRYLRH